MTVIKFVSDVSFPNDVPIDYEDAGIDAGTLFCFDVLDENTWPSQAAANINDTLADISKLPAVGPTAVVSVAGLTWSNGLVFGTASSARILLPTSSDLASDVEKFGIAVWVEFTSLAGANDSILTMGKSGAGYANTQYLIYTNLNDLRWAACGVQVTTAPFPTVSVGTVYQIGLTLEKSGATYVCKLWLNGAQIDTFTTAAPMVDALTEAKARIGSGDIFGAPPNGMIFYRANANDLTGWTAAEFIAADYAAGAGRF